MTHPTPTAPHTITLHLHNYEDEIVGEFAARLVPNAEHDPGAYAITHGLGSLAGGTHTEVAFVDGSLGAVDLTGDGSFTDPERDRLADEVVRTVAAALYDRRYAFTYRPDRVERSVLRHGSVLRERVEVSDVVIYG